SSETAMGPTLRQAGERTATRKRPRGVRRVRTPRGRAFGVRRSGDPEEFVAGLVDRVADGVGGELLGADDGDAAGLDGHLDVLDAWQGRDLLGDGAGAVAAGHALDEVGGLHVPLLTGIRS